MNIRINSNFKFRIVGIAYTRNGEKSVTLFSEDSQTLNQCQYSTVVSDGCIETRRSDSLLEYARRHERRTETLVCAA